MEGGSGGESAPAANAPASVATSKKKSLAEFWIELWIELWMELKNMRMHHPSKA
jgi:hypothetical protein